MNLHEINNDKDEAYVADILVPLGISDTAFKHAERCVRNTGGSKFSWLTDWLSRLTCTPHDWQIVHPEVRRYKTGADPHNLIRPWTPIEVEGRFDGQPVAELKCKRCGKVKYMTEAHFWEVVEQLRLIRQVGHPDPMPSPVEFGKVGE